MHIVSLQSENIKKLTAVSIKPDGHLVQITGPNGAGKTSVLDSIWLALEYAQAKKDNPDPIHRDAAEAKIRLDLGEFVVTRTFARKEEGGYTTKLKVESAAGGVMPEPQTLIDSFLGALCFDPLEFNTLTSDKQFNLLGKLFAPDIDFKGIAELNKIDYDKRTQLNLAAKQARAAADMIQVPEGLPDEAPDLGKLTLQLSGAADHNAEVDRRIARRTDVTREAVRLRERGNELAEQAQELRARAEALEQESQQLIEKAGVEDQRVLNAPKLPAKIDTAELAKQIQEARTLEKHLEAQAQRNKHIHQAEQLETQAGNLTAIMEAREGGKKRGIEKIQLPVPGLGFGDGIVLLDGAPFEQGSDAQRLVASVAIGMASNPNLRVLRVRHGSELDSKSMQLIAQLCEKKDYQIWIERVDESGKVGFVLEDGHLKEAPQHAAAASATEGTEHAAPPASVAKPNGKAAPAAKPKAAAAPAPAEPVTANLLPENDEL